MIFNVEKAKNNEFTLKLNGKYLYSKYKPREDAYKFIQNQINEKCQCYILFGLGLGYHLEALLYYGVKEPIIAVALFREELKIFYKYNNINISSNVTIVFYENLNLINNIDYQFIIPNSLIKSLNGNHPLFEVIEDLKIRQISVTSYADIMNENFYENIKNNDENISKFKGLLKDRVGCLISAGPSLEDRLSDLKTISTNTYLICVGSALNLLLANEIVPNAVIISDPQDNIISQLMGLNYKGELLYLSTANYKTVKSFLGSKKIIYQYGFPLAEKVALNNKYDLLETGGSVATTALSVLEYMDAKKIVLFGQDFGFASNNTHVKKSTSNLQITNKIVYRKVLSNNNSFIDTTSNLETYARWFEKKIKINNLKVYNTALNGRKMECVPYIDSKELLELVIKN